MITIKQNETKIITLPIERKGGMTNSIVFTFKPLPEIDIKITPKEGISNKSVDISISTTEYTPPGIYSLELSGNPEPENKSTFEFAVIGERALNRGPETSTTTTTITTTTTTVFVPDNQTTVTRIPVDVPTTTESTTIWQPTVVPTTTEQYEYTTEYTYTTNPPVINFDPTQVVVNLNVNKQNAEQVYEWPDVVQCNMTYSGMPAEAIITNEYISLDGRITQGTTVLVNDPVAINHTFKGTVEYTVGGANYSSTNVYQWKPPAVNTDVRPI